MKKTQVFLTIFIFHLCVSKGQLQVGYYSETCPNAESIVNSVVSEAAQSDPRVAPFLLRLHFHDCFVEGCDGSILINDANVTNPEIGAFAHQGVDGFDQIEKAKQDLEVQCPGIVSCADIVALAARDAVVLAGGPFYEVETGRKDGLVSNQTLANDMPDVNDSIDILKSKFLNKGLTEKELVLLSGAHTIGTTACFFMPKRLYDFTGGNDSDPRIDPKFLPVLKRHCPKDGDVNVRIPLDAVTNEEFDDQILRNIKNGTAVIASDARLYDDDITRQVVDSYVDESSEFISFFSFERDFTVAMVKMGRIGVKTKSNGEIRRVCGSFN
ncbi:hypothetical protein RD792_000833 [Penstemon davidsonii]|uniref:Peroxidase n=1 Tax=Penstemon davidsonii TaxID=160366 RepID=A0ABR0DMI6_9LAMI|nr:hypothetical protein RD792_000833 [Penstemon davidsonii]